MASNKSEPSPTVSLAKRPSPEAPQDRRGIQKPIWRIVWEQIVPLIVTLAVLIVSLTNGVSRLDSVLWTIVSFLLTQSLAFQVIASKEREVVLSRLDSALSERQEKLEEVLKISQQQPVASRREVIETLRSFYPAMGIEDKHLLTLRDRAVLTTFADEVLKRANEDLAQILSKGTYTMRVVTPSDDYVQRWYNLMESLDLKEHDGAEFITMSNIVIWSSDYFGRTAYGNLQSRSKMKIRRIFVVPSRAQLAADGDLKNHLYSVLREYVEKVEGPDLAASVNGSQQVQTKVYISADAAEYRAHFNSGSDHHSNNFAIWRISNETKLVLTVDYLQESSAANFQVAGITFGQSSVGPGSLETADKEESFRRRWESAAVIPIHDYLKSLEESAADSMLPPPR